MTETVEIYQDAIYIYDQNGVEIVSWNSDEWTEDPSIVPCICNAIKIAYLEGTNTLKELIGKSDLDASPKTGLEFPRIRENSEEVNI